MMRAFKRFAKLVSSRFRVLLSGATVGVGTVVSSSVQLSKGVYIGRHGYIGPNCNFRGNIKIGDFFLCADLVHVVGGDHRFDLVGIPAIHQGRNLAIHDSATYIGSDVWVGRNVTIMRGVSIGDGCVIGAGSVVTTSFAAGLVIAGVPAKEIRTRFLDEKSLDKHLSRIFDERS